MLSSVSPTSASERRRRWLSVLAKAPADRLDALWRQIGPQIGPVPTWTPLRRPETGLVMLNGRISGTGAPFCAGEMTVTRAAVRLGTGEVGIGYVGGRDRGHAETTALIDALGQRDEWRDRLEALVIQPLQADAETRHRQVAARAAATRVEFFTVAREAGS